MVIANLEYDIVIYTNRSAIIQSNHCYKLAFRNTMRIEELENGGPRIVPEETSGTNHEVKPEHLEALAEHADMWRKLGNLSEPEIVELARLELADTHKLPLKEQIERYILKVQTEDPKLAAIMREEIGSVDGEVTEGRMREISKTLSARMRGSVLYYNGDVFSGEGEKTGRY
jgi:hypothetical protein